MLGIAPMKGPNTGMMFVMPINTLMSSAKVQPQDRHCHKGDDADDGRVDDLADEEPGKVHVGVMADAQRIVSRFLRQKAWVSVRSWWSRCSLSANI